ncbi:MAG: response regulator [Tepidisphaeraceae bacterium]|jgi:two-component system response regulator FixJ
MANDTVFIVDDDPSMQRVLGSLLSARGYAVEQHTRGEEFLDHYRRREPTGCLLLDLCMPDVHGLELQSQLQAMGWVLPVIILTAAGTIESAVTATKNGAYGFLEKPVEPDDLLDQIRGATELGGRLRAERDERTASQDRIARLSPREREVLDLVVGGMSSKETARHLCLSVKTVQVHREHIMRKLHVEGVANLVRLAILAGQGGRSPLTQPSIGENGPALTRPADHQAGSCDEAG